MRLPDNRSDRITVIALIVVGAGAVTYGVIFGGIRPLVARKAKLAGEMERFEGNLRAADGAISRTQHTRAENQATVKEILDICSKCVLHPRFGNYLIGARRIIEQAAAQAGVEAPSVTELGVSVLELRSPAAGETSEKAFKSYIAEVSGRSGLEAAGRMIRILETSNPFLCVSKLQITADEKDPQRHRIFFRIQWPIWADPDVEDDLRTQIAEISTETNATSEVRVP
jgi:hypothetical protein